MQADRIQYVSMMQAAFLSAVVQAKHSKLKTKVVKAVDRVRLPEMRSINANLSYRTAQKLKNEGAL